MKLLILSLFFAVSSCSTTGAKLDKSVSYQCENNQNMHVQYSDDFERAVIKFSGERLDLHHYIYERGEGYQSANHLWIVKGKSGRLISRNIQGVRKVLLSNCIAQKLKNGNFDPLAQTSVPNEQGFLKRLGL